ncbi:MAG: hypothetical protein R6X27_19610 [Candidatus Desulfacyla sp.]
MGISLQLEGGFTARVDIQAQLALKGVNGPRPFHTITAQNVGAPSEGPDPTDLLVLGKEIVAEALCVRVGRGSGASVRRLPSSMVRFRDTRWM